MPNRCGLLCEFSRLSNPRRCFGYWLQNSKTFDSTLPNSLKRTSRDQNHEHQRPVPLTSIPWLVMHTKHQERKAFSFQPGVTYSTGYISAFRRGHSQDLMRVFLSFLFVSQSFMNLRFLFEISRAHGTKRPFFLQSRGFMGISFYLRTCLFCNGEFVGKVLSRPLCFHFYSHSMEEATHSRK